MFERFRRWIDGVGPRARIVVAEDDPEMRALLAAALRRDGYEVIEVSDGAQLWEYLHAVMHRADVAAPDLLVSDVRMPGQSGLEVLAALRRAEVGLPVVLITAFGDAEAHDAAFELGAAMLDKPFDLDTLRRTVHCLVGDTLERDLG